MPIIEESRKAIIGREHFTEVETTAMFTGLIAAMRRVCPDVW
jgi:hypothetical protein